MKNFIKENVKMVSVLGVAIIGTAALIIGVNLGMNDAVKAHDGEQAVTTPWTFENEALANIPAETTVPEETVTSAATEEITSETTTAPEVTTASEATTTTETTTAPEVTTPPETTVKIIEQTLASVQTVADIEKEIIQNVDVEIEPETTTVVQTTPAPLNNAPEGAEFKEDGYYFKYIDGVLHIYNPFGIWVKDDPNEGGTIIMDVVDKGDREQYPGG